MKYTVMPGDTMYKIAAQFNVSLDDLLMANPDIANPELIYPGQVIEIPAQNVPGGGFPMPELPPEIPPGEPPAVTPPGGMMPGMPGGTMPGMPGGMMPGMPGGMMPGMPGGMMPGVPGGMMPGMPGGMMPGAPGGMMPGMPGGMMPGMPGGMMPGMPGAGFSLKLGDRGEEVKYLQKRLNELGYYNGKISGHFGPRTKYAVKEYQKDCRLEANGIVNRLVWQSLG